VFIVSPFELKLFYERCPLLATRFPSSFVFQVRLKDNKKGTPGHALVTANEPLNKTSLPTQTPDMQKTFWFTALSCLECHHSIFDAGNSVFLNLSLLALVLEGRKESVTNSRGIR
jgi:hypothetical protein